MKVAYQTIIWGSHIPFGEALRAIRDSGFAGIELAQDVSTLIEQGILANARDLNPLVKDFGLQLVGLAGGSLRDRMGCLNPGRANPYLYVDKWDSEAELALREGFTLAVHVHAYMSLRSTSQVFELLKRYPDQNLCWIPDTGHLAVLNENIRGILSQHRDRLAAIHLKDWTPVYGRSAHRYARGFSDLGAGIVGIKGILATLEAQQFSGWVVAEQDYCIGDPFAALDRSARFLRDQGVISAKAPRTSLPKAAAQNGSLLHNDVLRFQDRVSAASRQPTEVAFQEIASGVADSFNCQLASVWACSPSHDMLTLMSVSPHVQLGVQTLRTSACLCGLAFDRRSPTEFDLRSPEPAARYARPELRFVDDKALDQMRLSVMTSVPVFSPFNRHYVRLILNLFTDSSLNSAQRERLGGIADVIAPVIDGLLDRECSDATAHASYLASAFTTLDTFPDEVAKLIRTKTQCEGVSIFWRNDSHDAIRLLGTTGIEWFVQRERYYRPGEGLTGTAWSRRQSRVSIDAMAEPGRIGKSAETIAGRPRSCLWEPIYGGANEVVGLARCQNKRFVSLGHYNMFSDHDSAVIEAIMMVAAPHIELLLADERRRRGTARMAHELLSPNAAIKSAVQLMRTQLDAQNPPIKFAFDYLGDVAAWADLSAGLIENAAAFGGVGRRGSLPLSPEPTRLMADIVAPAVRQVGLLLKERGFPRSGITYGTFDEVPALRLDRARFQQVIFNLLSNAIKFAFKDPSAFSVRIDGRRERDYYVLTCSDRGEGIPLGMGEKIFLEGFRAPRKAGPQILGQGLGLWIVREIIEAHGGRIGVTGYSQPTEISIWLPTHLK